MFQINRKLYYDMIAKLEKIEVLLDDKREIQRETIKINACGRVFEGASANAAMMGIMTFLSSGAYNQTYEQVSQIRSALVFYQPLLDKLCIEAKMLGQELELEGTIDNVNEASTVDGEIVLFDATYLNEMEQYCEDLLCCGEELKSQLLTVIGLCSGLIDCTEEFEAIKVAYNSIMKIDDFQTALRIYAHDVQNFDGGLDFEFRKLSEEGMINDGKVLREVLGEEIKVKKVEAIFNKARNEWSDAEILFIQQNYDWLIAEGWQAKLEEKNMEMTISKQYFQFLLDYECTGEEWKYAQDLGDGTITIAFGVVIKDGDIYPLGKEEYEKYQQRLENNIPLTYEEAYTLTEIRLNYYIEAVNIAANENNWILTENRFDALADMAWNMGVGALNFKSAEIIAVGDLENEEVIKSLEKEMLETAKFTKTDGTKVWSKNLVERRLDVTEIALGKADAYTKNPFDSKWWNENAYDFLLDKGLDKNLLDQYPIQIVKE